MEFAFIGFECGPDNHTRGLVGMNPSDYALWLQYS